MTNKLLQLKNVSKAIAIGFKLNNISFTQNLSQKIAVAGESGSGKTTLLKIIAGLIQADEGRILLNEEKILGPYEQLIAGHKHIAYLSQHYELLNNYIVKDLLWFDNKLAENEAQEIFNICDIAHLLNRKTNELSGGEKQRIGLCKLLIKNPKLLILDEPFSNLDLIHKTILKNVLANIQSQLQVTVLLASHDPQDVLSWADEIIVLKNGEIVQQDKPKEIYAKPLNEYVAGLFGLYNKLTAQQMQLLFKNRVFEEDKNYLMRPEKINIVAGYIFLINDIFFNGFYYTLKASHQNFNVQIYMQQSGYKMGDKVNIEIDINDVMIM